MIHNIFIPDEFDWDKGNFYKSIQKHGISPNEAEEVFDNEPLLVTLDIKHSKHEERYLVLGKTDIGSRLTIAFTIRNKKVRIISARPMNKNERAIYEKA